MRVALASLCFFAIAGAASAQEQQAQPQVLSQVYACAEIQDQAQRLACYDSAVGRLQQAQRSGDLVAVDRGQAETIQREGFGFSLPSLPRLFGNAQDGELQQVEEIASEVTRVSRRGDGTATITLANGQVWQQIDHESSRSLRDGGHVTIRRATLGSFLMHVDAGGPALRVRRVS
ncbi:hypothetical protein [Terricaulis sp.]|uniref:hypothetical protein n=1 Tax=Terricaulis sp. TaxID=2768686 RepID=UPI003783A85F